MAHGRFDNTAWLASILNIVLFLAWVYGTNHFFGWNVAETGVFWLAGSYYYHCAQE